jgi:RNA polymerase sigma-70 factor (ECF subfamily)
MMRSDISLNTSFESIWDEFSTPLRTFIKNRINNDQDVEDILQIIFLKIHNNIVNLIEIDKAQTWIYTIARNTIFDFYRAQRHDVYIDNLAEDTFCIQQEESSLNNEMAKCLKNMIQYLPYKYKQALILTEYENLTQKELALQLGISISGAKSRVQRARAMLKEMILNCCNIELDHRGNIIDYKYKNRNCDHC